MMSKENKRSGVATYGSAGPRPARNIASRCGQMISNISCEMFSKEIRKKLKQYINYAIGYSA